MDTKKELVVPRIENGTVIDHIPTNIVYKIAHVLALENYTDEVLIGNNLSSEKLGRKGIIKINNHFFSEEELAKVALMAPSVSIITIKNYEVSHKEAPKLPEHVDNFVKCMNPKCITNAEAVPTKFDVIDGENLKLRCHYCEKFVTKETLHFCE